MVWGLQNVEFRVTWVRDCCKGEQREHEGMLKGPLLLPWMRRRLGNSFRTVFQKAELREVLAGLGGTGL